MLGSVDSRRFHEVPILAFLEPNDPLALLLDTSLYLDANAKTFNKKIMIIHVIASVMYCFIRVYKFFTSSVSKNSQVQYTQESGHKMRE